MYLIYPLVVFTIAVLLIDAIGALASRLLRFRYGRLVPLQLGAYALMGVVACFWAGLKYSFGAGAWIGLVEATLGWAVSWSIGPGRLPDGKLPFRTWLRIGGLTLMIAVMVFGASGAVALAFRHMAGR